jgi:hypothetical protein
MWVGAQKGTRRRARQSVPRRKKEKSVIVNLKRIPLFEGLGLRLNKISRKLLKYPSEVIVFQNLLLRVLHLPPLFLLLHLCPPLCLPSPHWRTPVV